MKVGDRIKKMTPNQKLEYFYKNRKRIMKSILKEFGKHKDSETRLYDYAMEHPRIMASKTFTQKKQLIKNFYPYLTKDQIDFLAYTHKIEMKYGPGAY